MKNVYGTWFGNFNDDQIRIEVETNPFTEANSSANEPG